MEYGVLPVLTLSLNRGKADNSKKIMSSIGRVVAVLGGQSVLKIRGNRDN